MESWGKFQFQNSLKIAKICKSGKKKSEKFVTITKKCVSKSKKKCVWKNWIFFAQKNAKMRKYAKHIHLCCHQTGPPALHPDDLLAGRTIARTPTISRVASHRHFNGFWPCAVWGIVYCIATQINTSRGMPQKTHTILLRTTKRTHWHKMT